MKRMLAGWLCLFVAGCGAETSDTGVPEIPVGDPARVTPAIREACPLRITDASLASAIAAAEMDRDNGITKAEATTEIFDVCDQKPDSAADCRTCWQAILDEVYGPG